MRITFILPPPDLSGGIRVLATYAERLKERGHQVVAIAPRPKRPSLRDIARAVIKHRRWPFPKAGPSHFDRAPVDYRKLRHAAPIRDADVPDADVVIATWYETAEWVWPLAATKGAKVQFMQGYEAAYVPVERLDASIRLPIPKIVLTGWMRDLLREKFQQEPLAIVPNSVDAVTFNASPRGRQAEPTVGLVYSPHGIKGTDISLRAVAIARRTLSNLRLRVVGNDLPTPELPLPPNTDFVHQARDRALRDVYASCDAWLFGSRQEGFGMPLLEAMACRTPVIATPGGAAPDLIPQGGGVLVPHEDADAMAREIVRVCTLPDAEWRQLSAQARSVAERYTWDDATAQFEEALRRALAPGH